MFTGVSDRKRPAADAELFRQTRGLIVQDDLWLATARASDFNVKPAHLGTPASAQRFHHRLFGGETSGITFIAAPPFALAVLNFPGGKNPFTETLADTRVFQSFADALNFYHIH